MLGKYYSVHFVVNVDFIDQNIQAEMRIAEAFPI